MRLCPVMAFFWSVVVPVFEYHMRSFFGNSIATHTTHVPLLSVSASEQQMAFLYSSKTWWVIDTNRDQRDIPLETNKGCQGTCISNNTWIHVNAWRMYNPLLASWYIAITVATHTKRTAPPTLSFSLLFLFLTCSLHTLHNQSWQALNSQAPWESTSWCSLASKVVRDPSWYLPLLWYCPL